MTTCEEIRTNAKTTINPVEAAKGDDPEGCPSEVQGDKKTSSMPDGQSTTGQQDFVFPDDVVKPAKEASTSGVESTVSGDSDTKKELPARLPSGSMIGASTLQKMMDPAVAAEFSWKIVIKEILLKQIPFALSLAVPAFVIDLVFGMLVAPQHDLQYDSLEHKVQNNASFNVHMNWNPGPGPSGVLGSYLHANLGLTWSLWGFYIYLFLLLPYFGFGKELYKEATRKSYYAIMFFYIMFIMVCNWYGGKKASDEDGTHNYAVAGNLSPSLITSFLFFLAAIHRGRAFIKCMGNKDYLLCLMLCTLTAFILPAEVVYLYGGFNTIPAAKKEQLIFMYRLLVWPLIWYVLLVPLFRYCVAAWPGKPESVIPLIAYFFTISSVSSRVLMFGMRSNVYFLILNATDAILQVSFNLHRNNFPAIDAVLMRTCWGRCCVSLDRYKGQDQETLMFRRMLWFQAQSLIELCTAFALAFRRWAWYDARYIMGNMYTPDCESGGQFDFQDLFIKLIILVGCVIAGDTVSSYIIFTKGFPLESAFKKVTKKFAWLCFSSLNVFNMLLLLVIMTPIVGRIGQCDSFENGCSCKGIRIYQEICGCCTGDVATSPYDLCRLT